MIVMIQPSALEDNFLCSLKTGHIFMFVTSLLQAFFNTKNYLKISSLILKKNAYRDACVEKVEDLSLYKK